LRISREQLQVLARAIVDDLVRADAIELSSSHEAAQTSILAELDSYFKTAADLERDAERMADQHLQAAGRGGMGFDRHVLVLKIREKLAEERGFPV
jgi:hypothetical protein